MKIMELAQTDKIHSASRVHWIDQLKGFTIFLVVYGHNFPFTEKYIYSFHMPLFIMVAGFFHPKASDFGSVKKRFRALVIPYYFWALFLYMVWFFVSRKYGDTATMDLSPVKNFIGVIFAQGDRAFMDWGIPLWFLPALFLMSVLFSAAKRITNPVLYFTLLSIIPVSGFVYTRITAVNLPWSVNIAMVGVLFYAFGNHCYKWISSVSQKQAVIIMMIAGLVNILCYNFNIKIDMYRAYYGNELLFILNGIAGSLLLIFFFRTFPVFKFLELPGKFSLTILALQLLAMTFIKFILLFVLHRSDFNFSEWERFAFAILQVILLIPVFFIVNTYFPILNGGRKKI